MTEKKREKRRKGKEKKEKRKEKNNKISVDMFRSCIMGGELNN